MTEKMKQTMESAGGYQVRYKTRTFYGKTKNEVLAARNHFILEENSDVDQFITSKLDDGYYVNQIPWPSKKARPMQ